MQYLPFLRRYFKCHDNLRVMFTASLVLNCIFLSLTFPLLKMSDQSENLGTSLGEEEEESVLAWLDTIPLSRQKKNLVKDFSDGVLMAELLKIYYPKYVDLHNYAPANSISSKLDNWVVLNRKVLTKLNMAITRTTMDNLASAAPGAIQKLLIRLRKRIIADEKSESEPEMYVDRLGDDEESIEVMSVPVRSAVNDHVVTGHKKMVALADYQKKSDLLTDCQRQVTVLTDRVSHLEQLLQLKEQRIRDLSSQLYRKEQNSS